MQRFYSSFPGESPGIGLLLLRFALGGSLLVEALYALHVVALGPIILVPFEFLTAALLLVGLWTPLAGIIAFLLQLGQIADAAVGLHVLQGLTGLSLALLGPGAWSIDARLYGRRRIEIRRQE